MKLELIFAIYMAIIASIMVLYQIFKIPRVQCRHVVNLMTCWRCFGYRCRCEKGKASTDPQVLDVWSPTRRTDLHKLHGGVSWFQDFTPGPMDISDVNGFICFLVPGLYTLNTGHFDGPFCDQSFCNLIQIGLVHCHREKQKRMEGLKEGAETCWLRWMASANSQPFVIFLSCQYSVPNQLCVSQCQI